MIKFLLTFFSGLIKSDLQILLMMQKNASNSFLLKITQDKNSASNNQIRQISLSLKKAEDMINEIKSKLAKLESEKIII